MTEKRPNEFMAALIEVIITTGGKRETIDDEIQIGIAKVEDDKYAIELRHLNEDGSRDGGFAVMLPGAVIEALTRMYPQVSATKVDDIHIPALTSTATH